MKTILVVDDVPACRDFVATALEQAGFKTVLAVDGIAALQRLESDPVDLVVLDAQMPRMNGPAFLRALRADARFLALPVILLTSTADRSFIVQTRILGAQDYLLKSHLDIDDLMVRVKRHLALSTYVPPLNQAMQFPTPLG